jgi:hypothetical protein
MAQTAKAASLLDVIGQKGAMAWGVAGGSGTTTTVEVPQLSRIEGVLVGGATSATAPFVDTITNTTAVRSFLATHANNDLFVWVAFGKAKA